MTSLPTGRAGTTGSLPTVTDPVGRHIVIDERMLTEGLMFRYGYEGWPESEICEELEVTPLWLQAVWHAEPWLEKSYDAGIEARGRAARRVAERSLYEMTSTRTTYREVLDKATGEVKRLESQVLPSLPAVEKVLENRDPERWGRSVAPPAGAVTNVYINYAQAELERRRLEIAS